MEWVIKELESNRNYELLQIGLTPVSNFHRTQEEHDNNHYKRADDYQKAIDILKPHITSEDE